MTLYFILQIVSYVFFVFVFGVHAVDVIRRSWNDKEWFTIVITTLAYGTAFSFFFYLMFLI